MKVIGTIVEFLPLMEGESTRGRWVRGGIVIETSDDYPVNIAFSVFGQDRVDKLKTLAVGEPVEVFFQPVSRKSGDRWFTDLRAFQVNGMSATTQQAASSNSPNPASSTFASLGKEDDLPF